MAQESTIFIGKVAGSDVIASTDVAKVTKHMKEQLVRLEKEGWEKSGQALRHQRGYVVLQWLRHKTRLNAKKEPAKMTVGYTECEYV